ncbi:hypothetical protein PAPYR_7585 [Paratrimastix pyriformis]|uniref:Uncharacterized protein n=1 Tax=Paratrimastix pyriformis TaxID=342808 RepID=A0ABQ8U768_9EUKA|nr:hypothetical protein PAPYR_13179 [Paratrimastix pyriformis]KAJ4457076.1 hypothetical protein PAPYR_7585 [Paratrimastix pyriformis]
MQCMPDLRLKIVPSLQALNPSEFPELLPGFPGLRGTENAVPGLQALVLELNAPFKHTRSKILTHPLRPRLLRLLLRVLGLFQANPRTALLQAHYHHRRPHLGHCLPETENGAIEEMFGDDQADEPTAEQEAGEEQMDCSDEPGQLGAANSKAARRETAVNLFADDSQVGPVPAVLGSYTQGGRAVVTHTPPSMARLREIFRKYSRNSYDVAGPLVEPPKEYMVASFIKEGPFGSLEVGKALVEFWRFAMLTRRCCLAAATELEEKEQPSPEVLRASLQDAVASSEMLLSRIEGIRKQRIGMAVKASELLAATPASAPTQGSLFTREELLEMEARVGLASQAKAKTLGRAQPLTETAGPLETTGRIEERGRE